MWAAKTPNGPSIKMHVQNIHTMDELKMTGNCLKGSRGVLSFSKEFDESEWGKLTKEVFTHVSCPPTRHCLCSHGTAPRSSACPHKRGRPSLSSITSSPFPYSTTRSGSGTSR